MRERSPTASPAFSLIELLILVAVITLLLSILAGSRRRARDAAKFAVCAGKLRQLGAGVYLYAEDNDGFIPRGPDADHPLDFAAAPFGTNQIWIGEVVPSSHPRQHTGLGLLLKTVAPVPQVLFCPGDDSSDQVKELPRVNTERDAYSSYFYRHLDMLPDSAAAGRLGRLGVNVVDGRRVPVEALALDRNTLGPMEYGMRRANHKALRAQVLYRDDSVQRFNNAGGGLSMGPEWFADFPTSVPAALDQLFLNADFALRSGNPAAAPRVATADGNP